MSATMSEVRSIALAALTFSKTPAQVERRAHLDKGKLSELADSIKAHGLVQPILVRPVKAVRIQGLNGLFVGNKTYFSPDEAQKAAASTFEVVAGERRAIAAKQAGLEEISVTVRELTDEQVLELQLIENLQREDLHELAEAEGYEALAKLGHTVDDMAAKVGKSKATVYARMKLLALCPEARKAYYAGRISASVALLLARLGVASSQKQALEDVSSTDNFQREPMSYRRAQEHIQQQYMTRLDSAGFATSDPDLVPAAGACTNCPKRTGNQPELFGDIKRGDVCTDLVCFRMKRDAAARRRLKDAEASGQTIIDGAAAKRIAKYSTHSLEGGFVRLDERCYDDAKHRTYGQILGKAAKPALLVVPSKVQNSDTDAEQIVEIVSKADVAAAMKERGVRVTREGNGAYRDSQRREDRKRKIERTFRRELFEAIREKAPEQLGRAELQTVAIAMFDRLQNETRKQIFAIWEWEPKKLKYGVDHKATADELIPKLSDANLACFIHDCAHAEELIVWSFNNEGPARMLATAKRLKIDADKLRKELVAEQAARAKGKKKSARRQ